MARYTGPQCKLCRREGEKLYLKGDRCESVKCSVTRRKYVPGQHIFGRKKMSKYGTQFREKQKLKRFYGVLERQFNIYFKKAESKKINTGEYLLQMLERRLDSVVYHILFAMSRKYARQLINHGHIAVNGRKVDISSYIVKVGDIIKPVNKDNVKNLIKTNIESSRGRKIPEWITVSDEGLEGRIMQIPTRDDISVQVDEQYVIEVCSR